MNTPLPPTTSQFPPQPPIPFPCSLSSPLLISPLQTENPFWSEHSSELGGCSVTLQCPDFSMSLQTGLCCTYSHSKQNVGSSPQYGGTGLRSAPLLQGSTYLRPISGPRCLSSQLTLHPQWIHYYWDIFPTLGSWYVAAQLLLYRICHKPKGKIWIIPPLPHTWLYHSRAKGASLHLMHALLGIYYCLELLTLKQYQGPNNTTAFESLKFSSMF